MVEYFPLRLIGVAAPTGAFFANPIDFERVNLVEIDQVSDLPPDRPDYVGRTDQPQRQQRVQGLSNEGRRHTAEQAKSRQPQ